MKIEKDFGCFLFRYLLFHIASIGSFCKLVLVKVFYHFGLYRKPFIQPYLLDVFYFHCFNIFNGVKDFVMFSSFEY